MRDRLHPFPTLLAATALGLGALFFYFSYLPINHTYDGMVYASYVESPHTTAWQLFHPHHLLYNPLGRALYQWGRSHGAEWDGLTCLQFLDVLAGTLGLVLAFHLMVRLTRDRLIALFTALGLSLTYSYWYFSTTPAVRILASVTPLFAWWTFTLTSSRPVRGGLATGAAHVLAVLGHSDQPFVGARVFGGHLVAPGGRMAGQSQGFRRLLIGPFRGGVGPLRFCRTLPREPVVVREVGLVDDGVFPCSRMGGTSAGRGARTRAGRDDLGVF